MAKQRLAIPNSTQTELLVQCRRRCCLCLGLNSDIEIKEGQIAHLDRDPMNNNLDNLAWLCLFHHDQYDSVHRQSKGIKLQEVKAYRAQLFAHLTTLMSQVADKQKVQFTQTKSDEILKLLDHYAFDNENTIETITKEIFARIDLIHKFTLLDEEVSKSFESRGVPDDQGNAHYAALEILVEQKLNYPNAFGVLQTARHLWPTWKKEVEGWAKEWLAGHMCDEAYEAMLQIFEEGYELDLIFILYGYREYSLSPAEVRALWRFTHEHGQREYIRKLCQKWDEAIHY
jgi:hypothetical protein